ncbi:MAG: protein translocase subunit SecF [bacterium]
MDWQHLLKYRKQALVISTIMLLIALAGFIYRGGLLYGIEFTGGFRIMLEYDQPLEAEEIAEVREQFRRFGTEVQVNTFQVEQQSRGLMLTARGQQVVEELTDRLKSAGDAGNKEIFQQLGSKQEEYIVPVEVLKENFAFAPEDDRVDLAADNRSAIRDRVESLVNEYVLDGITRQLRAMYKKEDKIDLNWAGVSEIQSWLIDRQLAGIVNRFEEMLAADNLQSREDIEPLLDEFEVPEDEFWEIFAVGGEDARLHLQEEVTPENFQEILRDEFFEDRYEAAARQVVNQRNELSLFRKKKDIYNISAVEGLYKPTLEDSFYLSPFVVTSSEMISPAIGADLIGQAAMAIFISLFGILAYLYIRFELTYSLGAIAAILHDIVLTAGLITLLGVQFEVPVVAAILTVIGYSLNDTIVNFDRVRENKTLMGYQANWYEVINRSVYEVLNRTIVTSLTTFIAVLFLYLYGGVALNNFALTLLIGVITGTYSSVFISNAALLKLQDSLRST